jgi:glycosyltransferase involved in cell wall biosynthesis
MHTAGPLPISVVITAHNRLHFLREAIESVKNQSAQPLEIIVVDDGSNPPITDLPGVRIIAQANGGPPRARNAGIAAARGEWIALLDDDDLWEPDKLALQWAAIERYPSTGLVFTNWLTFQGNEIINSSMLFAGSDRITTPHHAEIRAAYRMAVDGEGAETYHLDNAAFSRSLIRYGAYVLTSSVLVRRDLAIACGAFDAIMPRTDDWDFWLRVAGQGASAAVVVRPCVRYRYHVNNVSRDFINSARWIAYMVAKARAAKDAYPAGMDEFWRGALPFYIHRAAWAAFKAGRFADTRDLYAKLLRYQPSPAVRACDVAARLSDTLVGHALYRSARRLKRYVKPASAATS